MVILHYIWYESQVRSCFRQNNQSTTHTWYPSHIRRRRKKKKIHISQTRSSTKSMTKVTIIYLLHEVCADAKAVAANKAVTTAVPKQPSKINPICAWLWSFPSWKTNTPEPISFILKTQHPNLSQTDWNRSTNDRYATRNQPLISTQKKVNLRHASWVEFLQRYSFVLRHKLGVEYRVADAHSRWVILLSIVTSEHKSHKVWTLKDFEKSTSHA